MATTQLPVQGVFDSSTGQLVGFSPPGAASVSTVGGVDITIQGDLGAGKLLTAVPSTGWSAASWQWYRDGAPISGATSQTYLQQTADRYKRITVGGTGWTYTSPNGVLVPAPSLYLGQITNAIRHPDTLSAASTQLIARGRLVVKSTVQGNIRIAFPTYYAPTNANGVESTAGSVTTIGCYIIIGGTVSSGAISGGGTPIQVTWGGQALAVVPDGTVDYLSDEIPGTSGLTPESVIWYQVRYENPNGIIYESGQTNNEALDTTAGEQTRFAASGLDLTQISSKASWTGGTAGSAKYGPSLVVAPTFDAAVLIGGTSINDGYRSSAKGAAGAPAAAGEIGDKGLLPRAIGRSVAYACIAQGGSQVAQFLIPTNRQIRMKMLPYFSHVAWDGPTNDLGGGGFLPDVIAANYTALAGLFEGRPFYTATVPPRTTGAWTLADGSDQVVATISQWATRMPIMNGLIRAGIPGVTGYFDVNAAMRLGSDELKWYADGVNAGLMTSDGLHPSTYGEQRVISQGVVNVGVFVR